MLEKNISLDSVTAADIMTATPKSISADELAVDALDLMRKSSISQLVVVENARPSALAGTDGDDPRLNDSVGQAVGRRKYLGFIHLHDLIREGLI